MKVYSRKQKRNVERQIHFGVGNSVHTACGLILFSRHVMVSVFAGSDGAIITDDMERVTCKRCLASREVRLRQLLVVESACPGIFDRESLCGEKWLLDNALNVGQPIIDSQKLEIMVLFAFSWCGCILPVGITGSIASANPIPSFPYIINCQLNRLVGVNRWAYLTNHRHITGLHHCCVSVLRWVQ
jgi:hypothetical protein